MTDKPTGVSNDTKAKTAESSDLNQPTGNGDVTDTGEPESADQVSLPVVENPLSDGVVYPFPRMRQLKKCRRKTVVVGR